jgi:RNA polymerase sigma factor (sigma-70 family)
VADDAGRPGPDREVGDALTTTSELLGDAAGAPAADARRCPQDGGAHADRVLFARYLDRRDPVDRDVHVERFLPLARAIARRYERPGEPFDDVFQVACVGLINAIDRFELGRDVAFSSYAEPTILGEIKRHYRDRTWAVRVPRDLQDLALRVERTASEMSAELHRQPAVGELALETGLAEEHVFEALGAQPPTARRPWLCRGELTAARAAVSPTPSRPPSAPSSQGCPHGPGGSPSRPPGTVNTRGDRATSSPQAPGRYGDTQAMEGAAS